MTISGTSSTKLAAAFSAQAVDREKEEQPLKRYVVVVVLFLLSMLTYVDRVCISAAKDPISSEMHLSDTAMGVVFGAFALGYALLQIPCGWLADRFGPRLALASMVAVWSALTALTGAAWNLVSLVTIRFLFGISEAGAYPGAARAICNWLPLGERGRANGILISGSRLGGAVSFPLLAWMLTRWQWRTSFWLLGGIGLVWAILWLLWFRDYPAHVQVEAAPRDAIHKPSGIELSTVLRSKSVGLAMVQYFASNFTFFIALSWMMPYLKRRFHLADGDAVAYAMAPLLFGTLSLWIAGWLVDILYRSRWRAWSRRIPSILGFGISTIGLLALTQASTPFDAAVCFTLAEFGSDMTVSPSWVFCADIAGRNAGAVSAAMNMIGNLGAFVSANAFPILAAATGSAAAYFFCAAALNAVAILCWLGMRSVRGVELAAVTAVYPVGETR
jgi:ACS family glucarate transporter-like MFS transporter